VCHGCFEDCNFYQVEPRVSVQAVKRNLDRFPEDFTFQLSREEFSYLKSQIVISSWGGLRRATPYAFTEQGVAMLSSVLRNYIKDNMDSFINDYLSVDPKAGK
jgi:hypothetical protein